MAFDVQQYRAAHRSWSFSIGEGRAQRTFTARHVSAPQVFRYQDLVADAGTNRRRHEAALRWLLRLAFPWRFSYLLRGDPVTIIIGLEPAARQEAVKDFFAALRGGPSTSNENRNGSRATDGTTSLTPTSTPRS